MVSSLFVRLIINLFGFFFFPTSSQTVYTLSQFQITKIWFYFSLLWVFMFVAIGVYFLSSIRTNMDFILSNKHIHSIGRVPKNFIPNQSVNTTIRNQRCEPHKMTTCNFMLRINSKRPKAKNRRSKDDNNKKNTYTHTTEERKKTKSTTRCDSFFFSFFFLLHMHYTKSTEHDTEIFGVL